MKRYVIGTTINKKWIIVSEICTRKQNRKILCYNIVNGNLKSGWIWDFTRDLIPVEGLINWSSLNYRGYQLDELLDVHFNLTNLIYLKTNLLDKNEYFILQGIREGTYSDVPSLLKKFDLLLAGKSLKRNKNLEKLIISTYEILYMRNFFKLI